MGNSIGVTPPLLKDIGQQFSNKFIPKLSSTKFDTQIVKLDLSGTDLTTDSLDVFERVIFPNCESLDLHDNRLKAIIFINATHFPVLTKLNLAKNSLQSIDDDIVSLTSLLMLNLNDNKIEILPSSIQSLQSLKSLSLSGNRLKDASNLTLLPNLCGLDICNNLKLHVLPQSIKTTCRYIETDIPDMIVRNLYLGSIDSALNSPLLKEMGVTHVLSICKEMTIKQRQGLKSSFKHLFLEVDDDFSSHIDFDQSFKFIKDALKSGKVLVHCWQGVSRSATICIMYVMKSNGMNLSDAYKMVKSCRPQVHPNDGFIRLLKKLEQE